MNIYPAIKKGSIQNTRPAKQPSCDINMPISFTQNQTTYNYLVMDNFDTITIDIDGDDIADLSHGESIKRLITALNPKANVIPLKLKKITPEGFFDSEELKVKLSVVLKQLQKINLTGINLSISSDCLVKDLSINRKNITKSNFNKYKEQISEQFKNLASFIQSKKPAITPDEKNTLHSIETFNTIEQITKEGIPVYIAAGNRGVNKYNLFSLANNCKTVSSTDANGVKSFFSSDVNTTDKARGVYGITPVLKDGAIIGYDLIGNGKVDVKAEEVSGKGKVKPKVDYFINKPLKDVLITKSEFDLVKQSQIKLKADPAYWKTDAGKKAQKLRISKLFSISQFAELKKLTPDEIRPLRTSGKYASFCTTKVFSDNGNGLISFNPDKTGRPNMVSALIGTSFASPTKLVEDTYLN